jgi:choline dehydrogenase-like flavoprotein
MQLSTLTLSLSLLVIEAQALVGKPSEKLEGRQFPLPSATFDYVIVGGGTAGLTMANRLAARSSISVAVIEAGSYYQLTNPLIGQTPAGDTLFAGSDPADTNPLVDWNFVTEPQAGAGGRRIHYARGKCLGGR